MVECLAVLVSGNQQAIGGIGANCRFARAQQNCALDWRARARCDSPRLVSLGAVAVPNRCMVADALLVVSQCFFVQR